MTEATEAIKANSARPTLSWATQGRAVGISPALPEDAISRIATLLAHGFARPGDARELMRAAEAVRGLRKRVIELEVLIDGREAERLVREYRAAGI